MKRKILPYNPKLKTNARALRKNMTLAEVLLWNQLKRKKMRGYDFDRQRPIGNYIVDFYCKDLLLAIEIDGRSHVDKQQQDDRRQQRLEDMGVHVLRFGDQQVKSDMPSVLARIEAWILRYEGTHPSPLPGGDFGQS